MVQVIDVPRPTAVLASLSGDENACAFIATLSGKVGVYAVGGLATEAAA